MKTLIEAILNKFEIRPEDARCSVREAVRREDDSAFEELRPGRRGCISGAVEKFLAKDAIRNRRGKMRP